MVNEHGADQPPADQVRSGFRPDTLGTMPSSPAQQPSASNLPADVTSFVGRREERREIRRLLSVSRLVTVTGFGGVGKTRLAMRVAHDVQRAFRDGVWFADLSMLTDPALLPNTVATALGLSTQRANQGPEVLQEHLAPRSALVILDNCEQLLEASAELVGGLLRTCPRLHILVTTREPLGVLGEATFSLSPLPVADKGMPTTALLTEYDGITLFLDRASTACPGFEVTDANRAAIAEICQRLDGIPLALELAAVRLRGLTPTELAGQLSERFGLLTAGNRAGPDRLRTLRNSIDWSYDRCTADERSLWASSSVFVGGMDLESVVAVCGAADQDGDAHLVEVLLSLVNKSVITTKTTGNLMRYRMLEVIRDYGREKLEESGLLTRSRYRHGKYFFDLADRSESDWASPRQAESIGRLRREHANLRAAFQFASTNPELASRGLRAAASLLEYWITIGAINEGRHWLDILLAATPPDSPATGGTAFRAAARLAITQGDVSTGEKLLARARDIEHDPDEITRARFDHVACLLALYREDWTEMIALSTRALAVFAVTGTVKEQIGCLTLAQLGHHWAGRFEESLTWHRECMAVAESTGESWHRAFSLWCAGLAHWRVGDLPAAQRAMREGLRLRSGFTDVAGVASCLEGLAWLLTSQDPQRSALLLGAAAGQWDLANSMRKRLGWHEEAHENALREVRETLGDRRFTDLLEQGRSLSREEALAAALETKAVGPGEEKAASPLTNREQEVANLVAQGLGNRQIANLLVISPRTAETHVENILTKLGFRSRAQIAAWVLGQ